MKIAARVFYQGSSNFVIPPGVKTVFAHVYNQSVGKAFSCGDNHMAAIGFGRTKASQAQTIPVAWGQNTLGQLGDGTAASRSSPVFISGTDLNGAILRDTNKVQAAGNNTVWERQYGTDSRSTGEGAIYRNLDGSLTNLSVPALILLGAGQAYRRGSLATGYSVSPTGVMSGWGDNTYGQIGDGTSGNTRSNITAVTGGSSYSRVFPTYYSVFAQRQDGSMWCWGRNDGGQLGLGTTTNLSSPVQFATAATNNWKKIVGGPDMTIGLKWDGTVWTWGQPTNGMLGQVGAVARSTPAQVSGLGNIFDIDYNNYNAIALQSDGKVWGWGTNASGQLGNGGFATTSPFIVYTSVLVCDAQLGSNFAAILLNDGTIQTAGNNTNGQLASGNTTSRSSFSQIIGSVTIVGTTYSIGFAKEIHRPGAPLPIAVTPGSTITINAGTGLVTSGANQYYMAGATCNSSIRIFWYE